MCGGRARTETGLSSLTPTSLSSQAKGLFGVYTLEAITLMCSRESLVTVSADVIMIPICEQLYSLL
ncbi:hypothetical protein E2C01_062718 [Portunus trituberculatus]|uniref:Uncharacterized protein n=1 Tax=Portunus trituberculatus TaxID=210409 RepID=A0A5B7HET9_PORTR|nr:hypothetical protein [Portunus trituberculatus]